MLVRLNQLDPRTAESAAGWTTGGPRGSVAHTWSATTFAYQLEALAADESGKPVADHVRRAEMRRAFPAAVGACCRDGDKVVIRADGPFGIGLMPAVAAAAGAIGFAVSAVQKLATDAAPPQASVRLFVTRPVLDQLCADEQLGLHKGVRLRAMTLPGHLVDPMIDTADVADERWRHVLPLAGGFVSTAADLLSVVIWTPLPPDPMQARLSAQLS